MSLPGERANIQLFNMDCMEAMREMPDKAYDLAITDPPYGLGDRLVNGGHKKNPMEKFRKDYEAKRWDTAPTKEYFNELRRVSKNQVIWGGNYFDLPPTRGIICWDKKQMMPTFSRWEMGWTSFDCPSKLYSKVVYDKNRTHPTQKPVQLYKWLLQNYAKEGDKILDTHLGSGSIAIACWDLGFDLTGYEIDREYYENACLRLERHKAQGQLF